MTNNHNMDYHPILDKAFTLLTATLLILTWDLIPIIAGFLAIIFWVPRIKREMDEYYEGSPWKYFTSLFTKRPKK